MKLFFFFFLGGGHSYAIDDHQERLYISAPTVEVSGVGA